MPVQRHPCADGASDRQHADQSLGRHCPADARPGSRRRGKAVEHLSHHRHRDEEAEALAQGEATAVDQLPGSGDRDPHRLTDLPVAPALHLPLNQSLSLGFGERLDACEDRGQLFAALERLGWLLDAVEVLVEMVHRRTCVTNAVQRRVADDRVEPGPQVKLRLAIPDLRQRPRDRVLDDVVGTVGRNDCRGVADQRRAVAPDNLLESGLMALAGERHQAPVGLGSQRRAEEDSRRGHLGSLIGI